MALIRYSTRRVKDATQQLPKTVSLPNRERLSLVDAIFALTCDCLDRALLEAPKHRRKRKPA